MDYRVLNKLGMREGGGRRATIPNKKHPNIIIIIITNNATYKCGI
jgi:hypothetical protein